MSTAKKEVKEEIKEEVKEEVVAAAEPVQEPVLDPERKVKIRLPKERRGEDNFEIVSINGKNWQIKKGEWVLVPFYVAEVLENAEKAIEEADAYIDQNIDKDAE